MTTGAGDAQALVEAGSGWDSGRMQSTERTIDVLFALAESGGEAGVSELCRMLGLGKATVHRILRSLTEKGMLSYVPTSQRYRLGGGAIYLGQIALARLPIRTEARPFLRRLRDLTGRHVHLLLPVRENQLVVDTVLGPGPAPRVAAPALRPIHVSASGKALLALSPTTWVEKYLDRHVPLPAYTPRAIVDRATFVAELRTIAAQRYAISVEEAVVGSAGLAFPLVNANEQVLGAIELYGPAEAWTLEVMEQAVPACRRLLEDLEHRVSYIEPALL